MINFPPLKYFTKIQSNLVIRNVLIGNKLVLGNFLIDYQPCYAINLEIVSTVGRETFANLENAKTWG